MNTMKRSYTGKHDESDEGGCKLSKYMYNSEACKNRSTRLKTAKEQLLFIYPPEFHETPCYYQHLSNALLSNDEKL